MTIFRNHNLRVAGLMLLLIGLAPGLMPARANHASAETVSTWLHGFAGENSSEQAWEKISQLNDLQQAPDLLLKKASRMISDNAELFSLPGNNPEPTDEEVFNVLIQEWNRQQQSGSMGAAIITERQVHGLLFGNIKYLEAQFTVKDPVQTSGRAHRFDTAPTIPLRLLPLASGTSINAP